MHNIVRMLAVGLLIFVAGGALYAGRSFIKDPSGAGPGMHLSYLAHSPFSNYFIPGIILFIVIGLFSLVTAAAAIKKSRH